MMKIIVDGTERNVPYYLKFVLRMEEFLLYHSRC
jgi:hypothetical protein